jgi:hypothetical protein
VKPRVGAKRFTHVWLLETRSGSLGGNIISNYYPEFELQARSNAEFPCTVIVNHFTDPFTHALKPFQNSWPQNLPFVQMSE